MSTEERLRGAERTFLLCQTVANFAALEGLRERAGLPFKNESPLGETPEELSDWDWSSAFEYASQPLKAGTSEVAPGFTPEDVRYVLSAEPGQNDEASWVALVALWDGRFGSLDAWCDYTGWD